MRAVITSGRWIWGLSGLVVIAALAVPGFHRITSAGEGGNVQKEAAVTRTVTVTQPVTSLTAQSYGAPVQVAAGPAGRVRITETITSYAQPGSVPAVVQSVSGGRLSLAAPACAASDCSVGFSVTVPSDVTVTVTTGGGPVTVSGIAGANLDSGGGTVHATSIGGPLTVSTGGGTAWPARCAPTPAAVP
jgi:hypothetical protein